MQPRTLFVLCLSSAILAAAPGCSRRPAPVSYQKDVAPILAAHCSSCHAAGQPGYVASGLDTTSYDALMKGTKFGPVVLPGDPLTSTLVMLIEGRADPSLKMPHAGAQPLNKDDIKTIRRWIKQGARND